jgi:hypothetical protein
MVGRQVPEKSVQGSLVLVEQLVVVIFHIVDQMAQVVVTGHELV